MTLDKILHICRKDEAAQPHTSPEQHIFTLPPLPSTTEEQKSTMESIVTITIIAVVTFTILAFSHASGKKCTYVPSLMRLCFPLYPISRWLWWRAQVDIFVEAVHVHTSKTIWAHFASVTAYSTTLTVSGYLNINNIQILLTCIYFWDLQVDWTGFIFTDEMENIIKLPSKGHLSPEIHWS